MAENVIESVNESNVGRRLRGAIVEYVVLNPGASARQIVDYLRPYHSLGDVVDFCAAVDELAREGHLVRVRFVTPQANGWVRSVFFPRDTQVGLGD